MQSTANLQAQGKTFSSFGNKSPRATFGKSGLGVRIPTTPRTETKVKFADESPILKEKDFQLRASHDYSFVEGMSILTTAENTTSSSGSS